MADKKNIDNPINIHHEPMGFSDCFAYRLVKFLRFFADTFFAERYGNRAVVLETIAAVPGMVGGALLHLKSLRRMQSDHGWIQTLLAEAENERMHLMTFVEIAQPTRLERYLVLIAQSLFYAAYFLLYIISSKTAHRVVGYLEEEAVTSYTRYLQCIEEGKVENIKAPQIAIDYWELPEEARLKEVVEVIRADEMKHREVNHCMADKTAGRECEIQLSKSTHPDFQRKKAYYEKRQKP